MPVFVWKGTTSSGKIQKGEIEAQDEQAVRRLLRQQRISPSKIKPKPKDLLENITFFQKKVLPKDIVIFTRQLSTMIDAGLPLIQGLEILASQQENKTFKKILMDTRSDIESGSTFADALKKHPNQFDRLFCNMVAAGEMGGILDDVLKRLADYMEKALRLRRKVKGALTYPIIVLAISAVVIGVILIFVIPVFEKMFADFGGALPVPTQMVVNLSNFVKSYSLLMIGVVAVMVFLFKKYYKTEKGKRIVDRLILKSPVFGPLLRKVAVAKLTRTLGTLIDSGVPILETLNVAAGTAGNKVVEEAIYNVRSSISGGGQLRSRLVKAGYSPPW